MLPDSGSSSKKKITTMLFGLAGGAVGCAIAMLLTGSKGTPAPAVEVAAPVPPSAQAIAPAAPPVRVERGDAPVLGPKNAPVSIVVWSDFQCPFCAQAEPTLAELRKSYGDKINVVWKNQVQSGHEQALPAAQAAMAAHEQGKFWEFHDKLFANQSKLGPALYEETARAIGLDLTRFREAAASDRTRNKVIDDARQGGSLGARGTPTFFVNGRILVGAAPVESFRAAIDQAIAER